ncbi:MAG: hypothetical protein CVU19_01695 [Betaproteobacteria bacterium HGW-Betaproteobacteria-13]|nr:MAG: hypothetical protein CVU19_01695 [Betaproteobacteria bacterium HGW-Betaproteobacteria-13]
MRWRKLGLLWRPDGSEPWAYSHAMIPTPLPGADGKLRIYFSTCDREGRGRPAWMDLDPAQPTRILGISRTPLLDLGRPGNFDDNGVVVTSVVRIDERICLLYYVGFELCHRIRYRLLTGLAISEDGGLTFRRYRETPILERSPEELYFRCGPQVVRDGDGFTMWYVAGSEWTEVQGKQVPVYEMRRLFSPDGIDWPDAGQPVQIPLAPDEHGFGRPWVVRHGNNEHELFFSVRRRSLGAYRLGYATSTDSSHWQRADDLLGLDVSADGWDAQAVAYSAIVECAGHTYCFYNGNEFGGSGFGCAVRESDV